MNILDPVYRTVLQMMAARGGDGTLIAKGIPEYDPTTSSATSTDINYPVRVLVFDYIQKQAGLATENNSLIRTGDKQVFIKPYEGLPSPTAKDFTLVLKEVPYSVITVKEVNPSNANVYLYELFVRQ